MALTIKSRVTIPSVNRVQFGHYLEALNIQTHGAEITFRRNSIDYSSNHEFFYTLVADTKKILDDTECKIRVGAWEHGGG